MTPSRHFLASNFLAAVLVTSAAMMLPTPPIYAEPPLIEDNPGVPGLLNLLEDASTTIEQQQAIIDQLRSMAPVPRTGQTISYAPRDDGDIKAGVSWPDPRFIDNGDGTVTDHLTGLSWLQDASCDELSTITNLPIGGSTTWQNALIHANNLAAGQCGLTDGSVAGDWRLPNIRELLSLIDYSEFNPALPSGHPFLGVLSTSYWSSTTPADPNFQDRAWRIGFFSGHGLADTNKDQSIIVHVWPVRGGQ